MVLIPIGLAARLAAANPCGLRGQSRMMRVRPGDRTPGPCFACRARHQNRENPLLLYDSNNEVLMLDVICLLFMINFGTISVLIWHGAEKLTRR